MLFSSFRFVFHSQISVHRIRRVSNFLCRHALFGHLRGHVVMCWRVACGNSLTFHSMRRSKSDWTAIIIQLYCPTILRNKPIGKQGVIVHRKVNYVGVVISTNNINNSTPLRCLIFIETKLMQLGHIVISLIFLALRSQKSKVSFSQSVRRSLNWNSMWLDRFKVIAQHHNLFFFLSIFWLEKMKTKISFAYSIKMYEYQNISNNAQSLLILFSIFRQLKSFFSWLFSVDFMTRWHWIAMSQKIWRERRDKNAAF